MVSTFTDHCRRLTRQPVGVGRGLQVYKPRHEGHVHRVQDNHRLCRDCASDADCADRKCFMTSCFKTLKHSMTTAFCRHNNFASLITSLVIATLFQYCYYYSTTVLLLQAGAKKRGQPISLQIFRKFRDRIAWKLVNFCSVNVLNTVINFFV